MNNSNQKVITAIGPDFYFATVNIGKVSTGVLNINLCWKLEAEENWKVISHEVLQFEDRDVVAKTIDFNYAKGMYKCQVDCKVNEKDTIVGESRIVCM